MLRSRTRAVIGGALVVLAVLAGCSRPEQPAGTAPAGVRVTEIEVGRSLNADKTISDRTNAFRPADIFYVSVKTEGTAPSATLQARWTYAGGQPVGEASAPIAPSGVAITELHASKPDGWPTGEYAVEVLLDGVTVGKREFRVE
jgi:hypothetical protein